MYEWIYNILHGIGVARFLPVLAFAATAALLAVLCVLLRGVVALVLTKIVKGLQKRAPGAWPTLALRHKIPGRLANFAVPVVLGLALAGGTQWAGIFARAAGLAGVIAFVLLSNAAFRFANEAYERHEVSKTRPIKGLLQIIHIVLYVLCGIVALAVLTGQSPLVLLGGIGALAAVVSFVFKDPILGFVAGIQLTANNMVQIGDWIEVPKYGVSGTVAELSMTTVQVKNFDLSVTAIPAYALVSDAFVNWRGMQQAGARRMQRSVAVVVEDVRPCNGEMLRRFKEMPLMEPYLQQHAAAFGKNTEGGAPGVAGTNLGAFCACMAAWLQSNPSIRQDMALMVRQLQPTESGVPVEVYAFINTAQWAEFEAVQGAVMEHFYALLPQFGLRAYQKPAAGDVRLVAKERPPGPEEAPRAQ